MKLLLRKTGYLALLAIAAAYATATFRSSSGVPALMQKRHDITVLQEQNATLAAENQRKAERIEKLEHDRAVQELEIRKRLKLLHPGETQFILPEQKPAEKEKP
jgi:cell division protein FtsB